MKIEKTCRGFDYSEFVDSYGAKCSLQMSSSAEEPKIWLGCDDADPKMLASKTPEGGNGWVSIPMPDEYIANTRMHLTMKMVRRLLPSLIKFSITGRI